MRAMAACLVCGFEGDPRVQPAQSSQGHTGSAGKPLCMRCGALLPTVEQDARRRAQRTMLGGALAPPSQPAPQSSPLSELTRTAVMSRPPVTTPAEGTNPGFASLLDANAATIVDTPNFHSLRRTMPIDPKAAPQNPAHPDARAPVAGSPASRGQGTLLGVARPGIAPLSASLPPRVEPQAPPSYNQPPAYQPFEELGATAQVPRKLQQNVAKELQKARIPAAEVHPLGKRRIDRAVKPAASKQRSSRRPLLLLGAAVIVVVGAVALALFWPRAAPIEARVRAADGGSEVLDLTCPSCPDGTTIKSRTSEGVVKAGRVSLPLPAPLPIGDSSMKFSIDRPGNGRDESVTIPARVAYRIRPDLATLEADSPSLQVVIEAMPGASVILDGEPVSLHDGRAVKTIDVRKEITGADPDGAAQLSRKITFSVTPPGGDEEKGVVAVAVPILPLTIDAPGRATVTEKPNFYLSGRTTPGAEIVVAGRSLGVARDGTFAQTMNVSSVGSTEIEVRAKMAGRAPRLVRISVERVADLKSAVRAFDKRAPITLAEAIQAPNESKGKAIVLLGEVLEAQQVGGLTNMVLRPTKPSCGDGCVVRMVQGRNDLGYARGSVVRAFGFVNGTVTQDGKSVPDIDVAFSFDDRELDKPKP